MRSLFSDPGCDCNSDGSNTTFINHISFLQRRGDDKGQECGEDADANVFHFCQTLFMMSM